MSKSISRTRLYLFAYFHAGTGKFHDMLWHTTVTSHLDHVDDKTIDKVCALEHHEALLAAIPAVKREDSGTTNLRSNAEERRTYGAVSRRALARRLRDKLQASIGSYWSIRIIEVGDFGRETRPVKHWNIERKYRMAGEKTWKTESVPYLTGIALREEARKQAKELTEQFNDNVFGLQYKLTAVAVYA